MVTGPAVPAGLAGDAAGARQRMLAGQILAQHPEAVSLTTGCTPTNAASPNCGANDSQAGNLPAGSPPNPTEVALAEAAANNHALRMAILGQAAFIQALRTEVARLEQNNQILWGQVHGQPAATMPMFGAN